MSLDLSRLRRGDQVTGIGAIAFFIILFFFKWYGGSASSSLGGSVGSSLNGWHSFHNSRWIWLLTIIVALGSVAIAAGAFELRSPVQLGLIVAALGALSTLLIFYRIVHHPSGGGSGTLAGVHYTISYGIKIGIWLGLIAAGSITYGGYLAMQEEGTSLADVGSRASGAPGGATGAGEGSGPSSESPTRAGSSETPAPPAAQPAAADPGPSPPLPPPAGAGGGQPV